METQTLDYLDDPEAATRKTTVIERAPRSYTRKSPIPSDVTVRRLEWEIEWNLSNSGPEGFSCPYLTFRSRWVGNFGDMVRAYPIGGEFANRGIAEILAHVLSLGAGR